MQEGKKSVEQIIAARERARRAVKQQSDKAKASDPNAQHNATASPSSMHKEAPSIALDVVRELVHSMNVELMAPQNIEKMTNALRYAMASTNS